MSSIFYISSLYNSYSQNVGSVSADTTASSLDGLSESSTEEQLMEACKSFESYFVQQLLEQAKKTLENEEEKGEYMQYFGDVLNETYAQAITDSGQVGLAQQLYDSVKENYHL